VLRSPSAIFPVIGLLILLLRKPKNAAIFATTMTAGFGIPVVPFAILAPGRLYNDIVQAQSRAEPVRVPIAAAHGPSRLREMTGLTSLHPAVPVQIMTAILILAIIFGSLLAASLVTRTEPAELDWFTVAAFATISAAFFLPPQFYYHFTAFLAPFLAMAIALTLTRLTGAAWPAASGQRQYSRLAAGLAGALIMTMATVQISHEARIRTKLTGPAMSAARRLIPPGACLITDQVSFSIAVDRVHLSAARLPAAHRPSRNQLRHDRRPRPANRRQQIPQTGRDLARRLQPRPIHLAIPPGQPQNPLDNGSENLPSRQIRPHAHQPNRRTVSARHQRHTASFADQRAGQ
jgi:hypothetical protein